MYPMASPRQQPEARKLFEQTMTRKMSVFRTWYDQGNALCMLTYPEIGTDYDYLDNKQLSPADERILRQRKSPITYMNKLKTSHEMVLGIYDQTRTDPYLAARGNHPEISDAVDGLNDASHMVADQNKSARLLREAFSQQVAGGIGWIKDYFNPDPTKEDVGECLVDYRDIVPDPLWRIPDYSDARFIYEKSWKDVDILMTMFPQHRRLFMKLAGRGGDGLYDGNDATMGVGADVFGDYPSNAFMYATHSTMGWRSDEWIDRPGGRLLLLECNYLQPDRARMLKNMATDETIEIPLRDQDVTPEQEAGIVAALNSGLPIRLVTGPVMRARRAFLCGPHILQDEPSPHAHNEIPYTPFVGYRDHRTGAFYGLTRVGRMPQDAFNRAFIKMLHSLATRQVWMEQSAGDRNVIMRMASDPSAVVQLKNGALQHGKIKIEDNLNDAKMHMGVMQMVDNLLGDMAGGLELHGQQTNADSGRAIALRQQQGHMTLSTFFTNFGYAKRRLVEHRIANIQQAWTYPKWVYHTDTKTGLHQAKMVNMPQPDGSIKNSLQRIRVDVVYDEVMAKASARQAFADKIMDVVQKFPPMIAMEFLGLATEMYDLPEKNRINALMRGIQQKYGMVAAMLEGGNPGQTGPLPSNTAMDGNNSAVPSPGTEGLGTAQSAALAAQR